MGGLIVKKKKTIGGTMEGGGADCLMQNDKYV